MVRGEGDGSWLQEELSPFPFCLKLGGMPGGIQTCPGVPHGHWEMGAWSAGLGRAVGRREPGVSPQGP